MALRRALLDAYNAAVKERGDRAERAARRVLAAWFAARPGATVAETREMCIALVRELGAEHGGAAGDAAYALRDAAALEAGVELPDADYAYEPGPEHVERAARYQAGKLADGDRAGFEDGIAAAARYFAERGGNDTAAALGRVDAAALGRRVRFARVPTGPTTCPWCLMLASRGFVYGSELSALNASHRNCDCRIVEGFDGMEVEGYDPDLYYDMWKHPERYGAGEGRKDETICSSRLALPGMGSPAC